MTNTFPFQGKLLGVACVVAADYQMSVSEFTDDDLLTQLETITVQMAPSECLVPFSDNDDVSTKNMCYFREYSPCPADIETFIIK